jgi:hypothetical protein
VSRQLIAAPGREADVEKIYGSSGLWSELLSRAEGYLGSELVCESRARGEYVAFDYWMSHLEFEAFRSEYRAECERFAQLVAFEGLLEQEVFLGSYYEGDSDEGTDIVPA